MLLIVTAKVTDIAATTRLLTTACAKFVSLKSASRFSSVGFVGTKVLTDTGYKSSNKSCRVLNVEPRIHR